MSTWPLGTAPDAAAWPTARTRVAGVIGHPVRHSLSPVLHNAAFAEVGLDWAFVAFDVPEGQGEAAIAGARALGVRGLSVTMPHKAAAARACDRLDATATALGVVNTVVRDGVDLVGGSTDGAGFVASLRAGGHDPGGRRCLVVGAGGAGRAVAHALGAVGAARVAVAARRPAAAQAAAALAGSAGAEADDDDLSSAEVVVNTTPVGMAGTPGEGGLPLDVARLRPGQVVVDVVYSPLRTPLLVAAEAAGCTPLDGLGMLVHQAALAFERWTDVTAPVGVMAAAARLALT